MPPRRGGAAGFLGLAGSDSEPDFDTSTVLKSSTARTQPRPGVVTKKPRGRPPGPKKITKPVTKPRVNNGRVATARPALVDKSTNAARAVVEPIEGEHDQDDISMVHSVGENTDQLWKAEREKSRVAEISASTESSKSRNQILKQQSSKRAVGAVRDAVEAESLDAMDLDAAAESPMETDEQSTILPEVSRRAVGDPDVDEISLRRRLGDLNQKHEHLEARYRELRQIGVVEAERNYERLKKHADDSAKAATNLIAELKGELAAQVALAKQGERVRQQLEASDDKCAGLQSRLTDLSTSLADARSEIKTLSTKLAACRSAEAGVRVPGSAMKVAAGGGRPGPSEVVQAAQAKEDLYGDLTGLILRGMKQGEKEDVFDCIQTGRNGTLHFKLALDKAESTENYEDVQFTYRPQLDDDRDGELMELLPDYLVEEITFPRPHASKFYARVIRSLTERLE